MDKARDAALRALIKIDFKGAYSNLALKSILACLDARDKAFASRLVYGCISMKINLDYVISLFSSVKASKMSEAVTELLRMGAYQMLYMDKVPDSAAVNESVKLAAMYAPKAKGFINGVLRSVSRNKTCLSYPEDKTELLRVKYSFPKLLCSELLSEYGEAGAQEIMAALNGQPKTVIRANCLKNSRDELLGILHDRGLTAAAEELCPMGISVSGLDVGESGEYRSGRFTVQDTAAQLACIVLDPKSGDSVIDMCAAPGGKTTYLAELMGNTGSVTAFDVHPHKTELIEKNAERLGIDIITACAADMTVHMPSLDGRADRVLADVPCSGTGIIRRKPDIKWNRENLDSLGAVQRKILENALCCVKPGGSVVYSTCSILGRENLSVVKDVLSGRDDVRLCDISQYFPAGYSDTLTSGYITLLPQGGTDGFFICKLRKIK